MSSELSKDEKERQLDAKIAAIRAKNEEKLQRQKEVEKDRKLAERQNQSVTTAPRVKLEEDYKHDFVGPDRNDKTNNAKQRLGKREDSAGGEGGKKDKRSSGRLRDGDGPPPDPGYRFLADRWRDGSESDDDEEDSGVKRRDGHKRREDIQPWSRGGGGRGSSSNGAPGGRGRGSSGRGGRGGDNSRARWSNDHDNRRDSDTLDNDGRGGRGRDNRDRGGRGRGGNNRDSRGGHSNNINNRPGRQHEDRTDNFIKDIRRNVDGDKSRDQQWSNDKSRDQQWSNGQSKQSPRHRPGRSNTDWNDQVESEWSESGQPQVPTALVSPRKIEEAHDGRITVTKNSDHRSPAQVRPGHSSRPQPSNGQPQSSGSHKQQLSGSGSMKPVRAETSNYPYGVEPPPFKENIKPLMKTEVGFSQHPSQYNKPFSSSSGQEPEQLRSVSSWKCPDPGCKQTNPHNTPNCVKCGISFKAASDYITNYACDRVKQEYSRTNMFDKPSDSAAGFSHSNNDSPVNGFTANPSIPQPMLQQQQPAPAAPIKDWNIDVEGGAGTSGWGGAVQTSGDAGWTTVDPGMMQFTPMEPVYHPMMTPVQVPTFPPPYYSPAPYYNTPAGDYYQGQPEYQGYQGQPAPGNVSVFNPAQVFIPPVTTVQQSGPVQYKPSSYSGQQSHKSFSNKQFSNSSSYDQSSDLVLALNKPPNPLSLRRPQSDQPRVSKLQERLNQNRQSVERDQRTEQSRHQPGHKYQPRPSGGTGQVKPPSLMEMQSGSLKKGGVSLPPTGKGNGLLILGSTSVDEAALSSSLNIPVKYVQCNKLSQLQEKVVLLNPSRDWFVLLHGLGPDARDIAETKKSDVEKANDADRVANNFCDIIENKILTSAGHIYVLVSMLLPRIDLQEAVGMGNPNNVRKVINVQITSRLYENSRVGLVNSDKILDWGDDDVRLNQLVTGDGATLTKLGHSLLLDNWTQHIKKRMKEVNFVPEKPKPAQTASINRDNLNIVVSEKKVEVAAAETVKDDTEENKVEEAAEEEEIVDDPFGSYQAPCELVSRPRTISTRTLEDNDDLDDDSLPNLETVNNNEKLENKMKQVTIQESQSNDDDDEFHDVESGEFIEDSYTAGAGGDHRTAPLPSMMSLGPGSDDQQPVSGHFMEDSYLPQHQNLANMKTVELSYSSSSSVKIAGDFNSWQPQDMEKGADNSWRFLIDLPEGKYEYKYFINGEWVVDESSEKSEKDGITNNFIQVTK